MKIKLMVVIAILLLVGCSTDGYNQTKLWAAIVDEMKTTEIVPVDTYEYVVRTPDGSVWIVECMSRKEAKITSKVMIFAPLR